MRKDGMIFWAATIMAGATGTGLLADTRHLLWAVIVGMWVTSAAVMSGVLFLTELRPHDTSISEETAPVVTVDAPSPHPANLPISAL